MSIAEQEAAQYFPTRYWPNHEPRKGYPGKECYLEGIKSSDIQEAYEQGRTAEPTEAEIEVALDAWFNDGAGNTDEQRERMKAALNAARKAVSVDE
ncbi:MAG: hypothetical protein LKI98_04250 [Bifidobacterium crudilactis]|jgi:predicted RNase H-like HicB family nuclease|nr:hypothetical protein [Bifidobacterium crudilactis]MCI1889632.1 hypothetical protein [Bifidobacterium crudilactis]